MTAAGNETNLTEDIELSGIAMKAGDKISMWSPNPQIGFGAGGAHFCLGANLARREIRLAFEELHRRIPDVVAGEAEQHAVAVEDPPIVRSAFVHGIKRLPIKWTPPL